MSGPTHEAPPASSSAARPSRRWVAVLLALLCAALAVRAHWETLGYALVGYDTYLQIISARVLSVGDFFDTFREELTAGRIDAHFYRPLQNLSLAIDYAIGGLDPRPYHVNTLVTLAVTTMLVFATARRLLGSGVWLGPLIAALFFGLHPALLNIVPTACRRSELLLIAFLLAALWILPERGDRRVGWRLALSGFFVLLAAGAKDIGVMGVGLVFLHQLFIRYEHGLPRSLLRAGLAALPAVLGAVLYLLNRTAVLGGFGGYEKKQKHAEQTYLGNLAEYGRELLGDVFSPYLFFQRETFLRAWTPAGVGVVLAALWLALALGALTFCLRAARPERARAGLLIVLGVAWCIPLAIVLGLLNWYGSWYAGIPVAGVGLVLGGLAELARSLFRGPLPERAFGAVYGAAIATLMVLALYASPLFVYYPEWRRASEILATGLAELDGQLPADARPTVIQLDLKPFYRASEPPPNRVPLKWIATIQPRGLQAYVEMRRGDLKVTALYGTPGARARPGPGEVFILCRHYGPILQ